MIYESIYTILFFWAGLTFGFFLYALAAFFIGFCYGAIQELANRLFSK